MRPPRAAAAAAAAEKVEKEKNQITKGKSGCISAADFSRTF